MSLRRGLRWALGATLALTLLALIRWPQQEPVAQAVSPWPLPMPRAPGTDSNSGLPPLAASLDRRAFSPAEKDLFSIPIPPAQTKPPPAAAPPMAVAAAPSPPPPLPPMTARYLGRFRTPEGQLLLYLRDGEQTVLARPGAVLNNGYVVDALLPATAASGPQADIVAVQLLHAARDHRETLRLPAVP